MSLIRYTPYSLAALQQQINRMFDQADLGGSEGLGGGMFAPAVDVKEDAEAYIILLEAPGIKRENLSITLQDNMLTIRGHKEQKEEQAEGQYRRVECSYGTFARSLTLPRNIDSNAVTADLQNGVLEVRLPKQEEARPRQINIGMMGQTHEAQSIDTRSTQASGSGSSGAETAAASNSPTTVAVSSGDTATESTASPEAASGASGSTSASKGASRTKSPRASSSKTSSSASGRTKSTKKGKTSGDAS